MLCVCVRALIVNQEEKGMERCLSVCNGTDMRWSLVSGIRRFHGSLVKMSLNNINAHVSQVRKEVKICIQLNMGGYRILCLLINT